MEQAQTPDQAVEAARALLDSRFDSIRALAASRTAVTGLRSQLAAAQDEDAGNYAAAVAAGWSAGDLKAIGYDAPAATPARSRPSPGRQRQRPARVQGGGQPASSSPSGSAPVSVPATRDAGDREQEGAPVDA